MAETVQEQATLRPAGYAAILKRYSLDAIPNWHRSLVTTSGIHRIDSTGGVVEEIYPAKYWPGDELGDQLEFALKYDGTNLAILASLFQAVTPEEFLAYVRSKPTGKYARRLWFLYEFLTGTRLAMDDVEQGHYIDLLDPDQYYTVTPGSPRSPPANQRQSAGRWSILSDDSPHRCPARFRAADLPKRCREVVSRYSPELLKRAMSYLYTKETKSSFEIEHINPNLNANRAFHCTASDGGKRRLLREKRG